MTAGLPGWARAGAAPCVTASCSECRAEYGDPDAGGRWHFESLAALVESVERDAEGYDEGYDAIDPPPWLVVGEELLCRACREQRLCTERGHRWEHHEPISLDEDRTYPERWVCRRCYDTRDTDPDMAGGVVS